MYGTWEDNSRLSHTITVVVCILEFTKLNTSTVLFLLMRHSPLSGTADSECEEFKGGPRVFVMSV